MLNPTYFLTNNLYDSTFVDWYETYYYGLGKDELRYHPWLLSTLMEER